MLPSFLGIGAPRCGTTWLSRCLGEHPDVFMASIKEANFFDWDTIEGKLPVYEAHFAEAGEARAIGEISVRYLSSETAPRRVREVLPSARLLVSLRNPVDQIYSHYWHLKRQNFHRREPVADLSFEAALERFADLLLPPARYRSNLDRWLAELPAEQLLILSFDDIRDRPGEVLSRAFRFLEVDPSFEPSAADGTGADVRRGTSPRNAAAAALHARLYHGLNRWVYRPLKRAIGSRAADRLKDRLRGRQALERLMSRRGYPAMAASTRRELVHRFAAEVRGVEELVGRDLAAWRT